MPQCSCSVQRRRLSRRVSLAVCASLLILGAACASAPTVRRPSPPTYKADSTAERTIARGLVHRSYVMRNPALSVQVLDIDLDACWTVRTVKAGDQAVGRGTTSALVASLAHLGAVAGVNADFFAFTPPGVPVGMTVSDGVMYSGANAKRPVFMLSRDNKPSIGFATTMIDLKIGDKTYHSLPWNSLTRDTVRAGASIIDRRWGDTTAALVSPFGIAITPIDPTKIQAVVQTLAKPVNVKLSPIGPERALQVPTNGWLWVEHGPGAKQPELTGSATLTRRVLVSKTPWQTIPQATDTLFRSERLLPREVVGGQPVLVRDSVIAEEIETTGAQSFRDVNPRTALGIADNGRRLLLVVIDGRQPGFSVGTTLRETAEIMRALGAPQAINLDGGGSSAMVVSDARAGGLRLANKPSDAVGERPVADALAVIPSCVMRRPNR